MVPGAGVAPLVLASRSPQRRAILEQLGIAFVVRPAGVTERTEGPAEEVALDNALAKARAARETPDELILGVDTIVELGGRLWGQPADEAAALATLRALAGATHRVVSGLALIDTAGERTAVAVTNVSFRPLGDAAIERYLATGEWSGRAGGYAIQGRGAALVTRIEGDYLNVVGLPVAALLDLAPQLVM